jgi:hypothetical protein
MKGIKTGKIDFTKILAASASGMAYQFAAVQLSKQSGKLAQAYNANRTEYDAAASTLLGFGALYFLPKNKFAEAAGYGLIGFGGAVAAQYLINKGTGAAVAASDATETVQGIGSMAARKIKGLLKANADCNCGTPKATRLISRKKTMNGVGPDYLNAINSDIFDYN